MKKLTINQIDRFCEETRQKCNKLDRKEREELLRRGIEILRTAGVRVVDMPDPFKLKK